jgi:hypothetical protein
MAQSGRTYFNSGTDFTDQNQASKFIMDLNAQLDNLVAAINASDTSYNNQRPLVYTSPPQTITSGGVLTLSHGLVRSGSGVSPTIFSAKLQNVTPEANWVAGGTFVVPVFVYDVSGTSYGFYLTPSSTTLRIQFTSGFYIPDYASGAWVLATNANWNLVVTAVA